MWRNAPRRELVAALSLRDRGWSRSGRSPGVSAREPPARTALPRFQTPLRDEFYSRWDVRNVGPRLNPHVVGVFRLMSK